MEQNYVSFTLAVGFIWLRCLGFRRTCHCYVPFESWFTWLTVARPLHDHLTIVCAFDSCLLSIALKIPPTKSVSKKEYYVEFS